MQECLETHALLKKVKFTRPPELWIKNLDISELQQKQEKLRWRVHQKQTTEDWEKFRKIRNELKKKIKDTKELSKILKSYSTKTFCHLIIVMMFRKSYNEY